MIIKSSTSNLTQSMKRKISQKIVYGTSRVLRKTINANTSGNDFAHNFEEMAMEKHNSFLT